MSAANPDMPHGARLTLLDLPDEILLNVAQFLHPRELLRCGAASRRMRALETDSLWRSICDQRWRAWPRYRLTTARERELDATMSELSWKERYRYFEADAARTHITEAELSSLRWHFNFTPQAGGRGMATLVPARFGNGQLTLPGYPTLPYRLRPVAPPDGVGSDNGDGSGGGGDGGGGGGSDNGSSSSSGSSGGGSSSSSSGGSPASLASPTSGVSRLRSLMISFLSRGLGDARSGGGSSSPSEPQELLIANFPRHVVRRRAVDMEWLIFNENVTFVSCAPDGVGSYDERGFLTPLRPYGPPTEAQAELEGAQQGAQ